MKIVRKNDREADPEVSLVLLDWGCRESFHTVEYLSHQTTSRDKYEVIWVEYYDREPCELGYIIQRYEECGLPSPIDTWIIMARPKGEIFRKHWMNNVGFLNSRGKIVVFMDSDAITSTTFVDTIIREFQDEPDRILYLEEIRTGDKKFYPFNYPSHKEIIPVAANLVNGLPMGMRANRSGLSADPSLIHTGGNYGACFAARRDDIIQVGGWDEHHDYTGYIAGPYELSMRMELLGKRELWSFQELLWHTPHPGADGMGNYSGPHDGKGVSTTAMEIIKSKRILPLTENSYIKSLRQEMFGDKPPKPLSALAKASGNSHEHTPTTPVKMDYNYIPEASSTSWNKDYIHLLGTVFSHLEVQCLDYEQSSALTIGSFSAAIAKQLNIPQGKVEAIYVAGLFRGYENALVLLRKKMSNKSSLVAFSHMAATEWNEEPFVTAFNANLMKYECYDGSGPLRNRGENISVDAYVINIAERFSELLSMGKNGKTLLFYEARQKIIADSGKRFSPKVVDAFKQCAEDLICIYLKAQHAKLPYYYPCFKYNSKGTLTDTSKMVDCGEFSIVSCKIAHQTRFYALPKWDQSPNKNKSLPECVSFTFSSYDEDEVVLFARQQVVLPYYRGFRLIKYAGIFFGIPNNIDNFKLSEFSQNGYHSRVFSGRSLKQVRNAVLGYAIKFHLKRALLWPARKISRLLFE